MEEEREVMARNTLFLAVTRPALFAGIPIEAAVVILLTSVITLIGTTNPVYGLVVAAVMFGISRLVVRHDVNLHTEILDTPDWFWNNRDVEDLYKMVSEYLEMDSRTAILNKRLDMLREMLTMLQLQNENEHAVKLEWIVILLIAISIGVESVTVIGKYLNYWK